MWPYALAVLLLTNVLAFAAMGIDKRRARRGGSRISERTLLWLAVPLASPGAWLGSRVFRHKTKKLGFRLWLSAVTLLNVGLVWAAAQVLGR